MTNDEGMTKSENTREWENLFWLDGERPIVREEPDAAPLYDLEERTARFGEAVIDFGNAIPRGPTTDRIISQLIGAAQALAQTMSKPMIRFRRRNFSSASAPAKRKRAKRSTFCAWRFAQFLNSSPKRKSCGWRQENCI
jgi:hypothetical protein